MTHTDILIFILGLLGAVGVVFLLLVLHEIISELREIKNTLEER